MNDLAMVPRTSGFGAQRRGRPAFVQRYWAFVSYSHHDELVAAWLQEQLECYKVPKRLVGRGTPFGLIPARLRPIFRDRHELAAGGDLRADIMEALASSRFLIVLCSPAAVASRWTNEEIRLFKQLRPDGEVLAAIVDGEPWAGSESSRPGEECFPPALKVEVTNDGALTDERVEPLAADLRDGRDGRHMGLLKLVAGMLDVGLDELVQREHQRRHRHMLAVTSASLLGMAAASALAITAVQSRDEARDQRRAAEGLVGFMLGDLKSRLEPIGRLDALDAVGQRALAYYARQDKDALGDESLAQRSRALTLMGDIAQRRGDLDGALRRYREAEASTSELARRYPEDPQRLFDHAQNVFYTGYVAWQRGQLDEGLRAFREYRSLADRMIALEPGKRQWQLERIYADTNLGLVLNSQERFAEAATILAPMLERVERMAAAAPGDRIIQAQLAEAVAYLADARLGAGSFTTAINGRNRQVALLQGWLAATPTDMSLKRKLLQAHNALARARLSTGDTSAAATQAEAAVRLATELGAADPSNMEWTDRIADAQLTAAEVWLAAGDASKAEGAARQGCEANARLITRDSSVIDWSGRQRRRCLLVRAAVDLAANRPELTLSGLRDLATATGRDAAAADWLAGRAQARPGSAERARQHWQQALAGWSTPASRPDEVALRAALLRLAGREAEAGPLESRLAAMNYRNPNFTAVKM